MFLHSGASLHGHEYSTRPVLQQAPGQRHTLPFLRSALRPLSDAESNAKVTNSAHATPVPTPSPRPALSSRPVSFVETPARSTPSPEPWTGNLRRPRPTSECFSSPRREHVVRFVEPDTETMEEPAVVAKHVMSSPTATVVHSPIERGCTPSEDEGAYSEASDTNQSITSSGRRRKRRTPRSGSKYILAQPPPRVVKRHRRFIQVRPKLVLQLQQLTETRPKPAYDVLPSAVLLGSVIAAPRLARRFPRLFFRNRGQLGANDLILAKSEDYDDPNDDDPNHAEDSLGQRELVAVISPRILHGDDRTDIVLHDGTIWTAAPMPNGSYEFTHEDSEGKTISTARWVKRRLPLEEEEDYKFTFSILDPSSRRHPIMATLTPTTLEILDHYTTVSPLSSGKYPPSRSFSYDVHGVAPSPEPHRSERTTMPVSDATKTLITVSSVWISLQLLNAAPAARKPSCATTTSPQPHSRSFSVQERRISFHSVVGAAAESLKPTTAAAVAAATVQQAPTPSGTPAPLPYPNSRHATEPITPVGTPKPAVRRASSTGAAFMQRRRTAALERQAADGVETGDESSSFGNGSGNGAAVVGGPASSEGLQAGQKKGFYSMIKRAFRRTPRDVRT